MKNHRWQILLGLTLLTLSTLFYGLHFFIFRDSHHIFIYMLGDIGFVFIEVLLVTLIINGLLEQKDRRNRLKKLNMVIGAFFSEVGTPLLSMLAIVDADADPSKGLEVDDTLSLADKFNAICTHLGKRNFKICTTNLDWPELKQFLSARRSFMLGLLQNQNLLEHESFTDVLWAIFHLTEELEARDSFDNLPQSDIEHLRVDIERAYGQTACHWVGYMEHLRTAYPYLFSLALRINPFNQNSSAVVNAS